MWGGVELSSVNVAKINKIIDKNIINGNYEDMALSEQFDFIYLRQVFEHFLNVEEIIFKFKVNLNDNGYVYINIPNGDSEKYLNESISKDPHTFHFTKNGLNKVFESNGFETIFIDYYDWKKGNRFYNDIKFSFKGINGLERSNKNAQYLIGLFKLKQ